MKKVTLSFSIKKTGRFVQRSALFFLAFALMFSLFEAGVSQALAESNAKKVFNPDYQLAPLESAKQSDERTVTAEDAGVNTDLALPKVENPKGHKSEDVAKRSAFTSTYVNNDGTKSLEWTPYQQNYNKDGKWHKLSEKLQPEEKPKPESSLWQKITGTEPKAEAPSKFTANAGNITSEFKPLAEGLTIAVEDRTFTITPKDAKNAIPQQLDDRSVIYRDVWTDTDLIYEMRGESIKEIIVLKSKNAKPSYSFAVKGGKVITHPTRNGELAIEGLSEDYSFSSLTLDLQDRGVISEQRVTQAPGKDGKTIEVAMDAAWLKAQPASSFPMRIDPSYQKAATSYWMYKSDGYSCGSSNCYANTGAINDGGWKGWRTYFQFPFSNLAGKKILNARLDGYFKSGIGGDTAGRNIWMGHANCISYNCLGYQVGWAGGVSTNFGIDFTNGLQYAVDTSDWGTVWSLWGEESNYKTYKPYYDLVAVINYDTPTPVAQPVSPANGQVAPTTQPILKVGAVGDADGDAVKYYFRVSTNPQAEGGAVINSGWITTPQWTIPDGILQDGTTYYWHTYTLGATQTNPNWVRSFKIDQRSGQDNSQTYDTVGPVGINLATGNATLQSSSHNMSALGGSIGVGLNYNTPQRAKKGLKGEYWNIPSNRMFAEGAPTGTPNLIRADPDINFDWGTTSPGTNIGVDYWFARWTGKMVVPRTGNYTFGAAVDDIYAVYVNGNKVAGSGIAATSSYTNSIPVALTAGQVIDLRVEYKDDTASAYMKLYVKGAVDEQIVPRDWLYTEDTDGSKLYGLTGRYYTDNSNAHDLDVAASDPMRLMFARQDTKMTLDFGTGAPVPGMQADNFMARWTGYITAPATGDYQLGVNSDDGVRIKLNNGLFGAQTTPIDKWSGATGLTWSSNIHLEAGKQVPITIDWYEIGGGAALKLQIQGNGYSPQEIPVSWLTPKANALPEGWQLNVDVDGDISYERLRLSGNSIVLEDSTRQTHTYTAVAGGGYKPPVNEDGVLAKNTDGTFTLTDVDGRVYIFNTDGTLKSVTTPTDDRNPAALKYFYGTDQNGGGIPRLLRIEDGVNSARNATLHYKGVQDDNMCGHPGGFDDAPSGMLCAVKTSDGKETRFYYQGGQLARVARPGNDLTDYQYNANGQIIAVRDSVASDAIAAGVRSNDETSTTQLFYDAIGRISSVKAPAATSDANQLEHTFEYLPDVTGYAGATQMRITGASEPNGYSKRVEYDELLRSTKVTDLTGKTAQTEWDSVKDLQLSTTDATGLKSTTIYDQDDRAIDSFGPAPSSWYETSGTNIRKPLATYANQVPHTSTGYDENIKGFAVSWYNLKSANMAMFGAPKINQLGYASPESGSNPAHTRFDYRNYAMPMTPDTSISGVDGFGIRATGKLTFPSTGTYTFKTWADDSVRITVDDQVLINNWGTKTEGITQNIYTATFSATAGKPYRVSIEYGHVGTPGVFDVWLAGPGIADNSGSGYGTRDWSAYLKPGYNLTTTSTTYDSQLGNITSTTQYANPAYGTIASTTLDPSGLNLVNQAAYEAPGTGFLRQTSKTLPGGAKTTYQSYSAADTRDNPCTPEVETYHQAGRPKGKTEPDPDGAGLVASRSSETIYNESGNTVATRYNDDPWTCTTYDVRGRITQTVVPAIDGRPGRTVSNNYAVDGNPLISGTSDSSGTITVENDLLGRIVKYTDARDNVTTNTYDDYGKLTQRVSQVGTESFIYDQFDRLITYKVDTVPFATVTYDEFSRIQSVQYPGGMSLAPAVRDALGRVSKVTYAVNGQTITDEITRSTSGMILSGTENGVAKSYTYDKADRLLSATIGTSTFGYGFGTPDGSCSSLPGNNPNAAKNSNRTSYTVNGQTTTYCYDMADRLLTSSDSRFSDVQYDDHGNTTSLGDSTHKTEFTYDALDRNTSIKEMTASNTRETTYQRDVTDRILRRTYKVDTVAQDDSFYGFIGSSDSPSFLTDANGMVTQKYLSLPGGVKVTVKPQSTSAGAVIYSLANIHGDIMATVDADGMPAIVAPTGPFGEPVPDHTASNNAAVGTSNDYLGTYHKATEKDYMIQPIQMGARVYIPELGRFLQVDPVEGGTLNNYVYVQDPVNQKDINGQWALTFNLPWANIARAAAAVVAVVATAIAAPAVMVVAASAVAVVGISAVFVKTSVNTNTKAKSTTQTIVQNKKQDCRCTSYTPAPPPYKGTTYAPVSNPKAPYINSSINTTQALLQAGISPGGFPIMGDGALKPFDRSAELYPIGSGWRKESIPYFFQDYEVHYNINDITCQYADLKYKNKTFGN